MRNADVQLSETEQAEPDCLLTVDYFTLLKTRARYTLAPQTGQL